MHHDRNATGSGTAATYPEILLSSTRQISYLPLCHAAEQGFSNFVGLRAGGQVYFLPDLAHIKEALTEVRPTAFLGVPRVWEKFEAALRGKLAAAKGIKAKLADWALRTELAAFYASLPDPSAPWSFKRKLANKLVVGKIKAALGLENVALCATGAAPISLSTLEFFASLGLPLHEGYGMTETSAFATLQPMGQPKFGTIGRPFPGVEARIAEDGEILLRGDNMVKGYYKLPDKNAELWTEDGWMSTGDLGEMDADGFLKITGRKKDLIITAGGKNVAPAEIEGLLQALPGVGQAVVVGDRQPYLCALLVLDHEALPALAKAAGVEPADARTLATSDTVRAYLHAQIDGPNINGKLARYQTVKKFELIHEPFTVEGGELTPTMKVKRNVVNDKYAAAIDAMYAKPEARQSVA
jgi:long-subunit acyl-CoA synthetase (AMP-forming)